VKSVGFEDIKTGLEMIRIALKYPFVFIPLLLLAACGHTQKDVSLVNEVMVRDTSITKASSISDLFLDSVAVEQFVVGYEVKTTRADQLRSFYASRNYQFAWFTKDGLAQQGHFFWNLHNNYINYSQDSSFFNTQLHQQMKKLMNDEEDTIVTSRQLTNLELQLTDHFFDYAQYAYAGKIDPDEIKWHIPRKKINAIALLDTLISRNGKKLDDWEPLNQSYKQARKELLRLYDLQKGGGWQKIESGKKAYRLGDSSHAIQQLKIRLQLAGDYQPTETSPLFTPALEEAVKRAQRRFGLKADGIVGTMTLKQLNVPIKDRIEQLLVNMERMRWMPQQREGKRLVANIPEFKLHVYEGSQEMFNMKIVVGKAANKTVVFNDQLKHVVFSPYWNAPRSIVRNEILPAMHRDADYLSRNNMEQIGTSGGLPIIRQKPGGSNALGRVKFIFPNSYNIYFHDTPAKSLFQEERRAFSHGCIRLEKPQKLAEYLLKNQPQWTTARITNAMYAATEKWVALKEPVAVVITYLTAWVNDEGLLHFREDIYGHDKELAERLFAH
jgi:L,D-transpeptidase YcbB